MIRCNPADFRILVVEDDPVIRQGTVHLLEKAGYGVAQATSGEEALQTLQVRIPDLVLLDRDLGGLDGLEVCRRIKGYPPPRIVSWCWRLLPMSRWKTSRKAWKRGRMAISRGRLPTESCLLA